MRILTPQIMNQLFEVTDALEACKKAGDRWGPLKLVRATERVAAQSPPAQTPARDVRRSASTARPYRSIGTASQSSTNRTRSSEAAARLSSRQAGSNQPSARSSFTWQFRLCPL